MLLEGVQHGEQFFLVDEGREDPSITTSGPLSPLMAFGWSADDGPTLNTGLVVLQFTENPDLYC